MMLKFARHFGLGGEGIGVLPASKTSAAERTASTR